MSEDHIDYGVETRQFSLGKVEIRAVNSKADEITLSGRASNHGNYYDVVDSLGQYSERTHYPVLKDCDTSKCALLFGHNTSALPYATVRGGSLKISETQQGINWTATCDLRRSDVNDLACLLEKEPMEGSVGMVVGRQSWSKNMQQREIYGLKMLADVTITPYGANPETSAGLHTEVARMIAMAEVENRSGKVIGKKLAGSLLSAHKQMVAGNQLHTAGAQALSDILTINGYSSGLASQDGSSTGAGQTGGAPGTFGDGTGSRSYPLHDLFPGGVEQILDDESLPDALIAQTLSAYREEAREMERNFQRADRALDNLLARSEWVRNGGSY